VERLGDVREGDHLKAEGVGGRIILKWFLKSGIRDIDWIDLAQDKDRWLALVNAVMSLRVP
jgi:hypothetical protein